MGGSGSVSLMKSQSKTNAADEIRELKGNASTVMCHMMMFCSTVDLVYDGGPIRL